MDDQAPPPYTPSDPHAAPPPNNSSNSIPADSPVLTSVRSSYLRRDNVLTEPTAAGYFEERPCTIQYPSFILRHSLNLISDVTRNDLPFPQPEERYHARDVTDDDWHTFTNYLLSVAHNEASMTVPPTTEETPGQQERFAAIVAEWNQGFFGPRGILLHYEPTTPLPFPSRAVSSQAAAFGAPPTYAQPQNGPSSSRSVPFRPASYGAVPADVRPLNGGALFDNHQEERWRSHTKYRSRSRSSSTSSSSSSSEDSVDSISSRDLNGLNNGQVQQPLASFRRNAKINLTAAVSQLRSELRSQARVSGSGYGDRRAKAQTQGLQREIKDEIRALVRSRHDAKRAWKQERRALKRERKEARRELRRDNKTIWREEKQKYKAAKNEAKHARKTEKKARKLGRKSGGKLGQAQSPRMGFRGESGQETGVIAREGLRTGAPRMMDQKVRI